MRSVARAAALLLIAPFLTFASATAPQHVHEPGPGHDRDHPVAHSHFAPHASDAHAAGGTEIEHDIQHVVWLDSPILHESSYRASSLALALPVTDDAVAADATWTATPTSDAAPLHGPPKGTPRFRGPPPSLV